MRFNENELAVLAHQTPEWEGRLLFKPPKSSSGFVGRGQSEYKDRWFRLRANFLFYWRIPNTVFPGNEKPQPGTEPLGVLVLEGCHVQQEGFAESVHAFSLLFNEDSVEKKFLFLGDSHRQVQQWIAVLRRTCYDTLREKLIKLQIALVNRTGRDPLLGTGFENNPMFCSKLPKEIVIPNFCDEHEKNSPKAKPRKNRLKSTFQSHVVESWENISLQMNGQKEKEDENNLSDQVKEKKASFKSHVKVPEGNLIDL